MSKVKVALIGCGVIGERRLQNLPEGCQVTGVYDPRSEKAEKLASLYNCKVFKNIETLLSESECHAVFIAAINSAIVPSAILASKLNIPCLLEKPAARSWKELSALTSYTSNIFKIGFNHRFHPAFQDILHEIKIHNDDPIMFINASYGNGARLGFDQEWRSKVELSGGGELLDQGVHLIDLASCILPHLDVKTAWVRTHYWNMPVDDNAWSILTTPLGQTFSMHVSSSEWKNTFRFEVYTRNRKYSWEGLGRSYGPEKLTIYSMKPEMGPPDKEERVYPQEDFSWLKENQNFINSIFKKEPVNGGLEDALHSLRIVESIYEKSQALFNNSIEFKNVNQSNKQHLKHPQWWLGDSI